MAQSKDRKKLHHYVHDGYVSHWRDTSGAIHVLNRTTGKSFAPTGRGVGAESRFNDFSFDPMVIDLLHYAFSKRLRDRSPAGEPAAIMLSLVRWAKDAEYLHKEHNFFEDLYEIFENDIGIALAQIRRGDQPAPEEHNSWGLNLLFFYFLQCFRVPKARQILSGDLIYSTDEGSITLSENQKREFSVVHMLINSLCAACDAYSLGYTIRIRRALVAGKIINCDAPAVVSSSNMEHLKELRGWMPLTPRMVMEIDSLGGGSRTVISETMGRDAVSQYNRSMLRSAHKFLYFDSASQCAHYRRLIKRSNHTI